MDRTYADFVILLVDSAEEIQFRSVEDFERIMREDNFELLHETPVSRTYRPTKERQSGTKSFVYVVTGGNLKGNSVVELNGN